MGAEPASGDVMRRGPRPPDQSVLGAGLWQRVLVLGLVIALVTLAVGAWGHETGRPWQTLVFVAISSLQLGVALGLRPRQRSLANPLLLVAVVGSFGLAVGAAYVPVLRDLLGTAPLSAAEVSAAGGTVLVGWVAAQLTRNRDLGAGRVRDDEHRHG